MKLQQLRYLVAVVENGLNITTAAEALYTSQPGVSKQLRLLEDELGLKLFVRNGKRLEALTPAGEKVVDRAARVLREASSIKSLAEELRGDVRGRLSLATTQTQARYVLPTIIRDFRERFPEVDFELHQGTSEQIGQMMSERQVDFAMVTDSSEQFAELVKLPVYRWDRVIIVPKNHPLTRIEGRLDLPTLAGYPLVTYLFSDRPESSLMSSFQHSGLSPRIAFTARDSDVIKTYVRTGLGVGIVAGMAIEVGTDDDLVALDARHLFPRLTTWVGFHRDLLLKNLHGEFLRLLLPHLEPHLVDDLMQGRPTPGLDELIRLNGLPLRTGPGLD
jgi:LysR family transcriptional regulator, cys regulon transcriptional activator